MKKFVLAVLAVVVAFGLALPSASAGTTTKVDLELSLLVDISQSISSAEFALQRSGYEQAFRDAAVISKIESGAIGAIAVNLIYWSGSSQQYQVVGWTLINSAATANAFADAIAATNRPPNLFTAIGNAINYAVPLFGTNSFDGTRQVIDVSGDGKQNDGVNTATARNNALLAGIDQINGLVINRPDEPDLFTWYQANVMGGDDAFVMQANTFADFGDAVKAKILEELSPLIPAPGSLLLVLLGASGGLAILRRKTQDSSTTDYSTTDYSTTDYRTED